jgi:hypothetical protein
MNARTKRFLVPHVVAATVAGVATGCGGSGASTKKKTNGTVGNGVAASGSFSQVGSLATGRVGHTATYITAGPLAGKVLIVGGRGRSGTADVVLDSAELYDPSTGTFSVVTGTLAGAGTVGARGRMMHGAADLGTGEVLIIGGQTDVAGANALASCEIFNPTSQTFGPAGTLSDAKAEPVVLTYSALGTSNILIAGGRKLVQSSIQTSKTVNVYRPDVHQLLSSQVALQQGVYGADAVDMGGGKFLILGGRSKDLGASSETIANAQVFDSNSPGSFALGVNPAKPRYASELVSLGGQPMVVGGRDQVLGQSSPAEVEIFDAAHSTWATLARTLITPRSNFAAVRLSTGDILVMGGVNSLGQTLNSTEVISGSGTNASIAQGPVMRIARRNFTATVLPNDYVLVTGGEDANGAPLAAAELFVMPGLQPPAGSFTGGITPGGPGAPTLSLLSPNSGPEGTQVTISGSNFSPVFSQNIVRFNGVVAPVKSGSASSLTVLVPNGAKTGEVSVQVSNMVSTSNPIFTVGTSTTGTGGTGTTPATAPRILFVIPSSGPAFMPIAITGFSFSQGMIPFVNNVPSVAIFSWSTQNLPLIGSVGVAATFVPPAAPSGPGSVVLSASGMLSNPAPFTVN